MANVQVKNFAQAILSFENALKLNPKDAGALVGSGLLAERSGDWARAAAQLRVATDVAPTDVEFLLLADALRGHARGLEAEQVELSARKISLDLSVARNNADGTERFFGCPAPEIGRSFH
jgi:uncharacterized protein HemY